MTSAKVRISAHVREEEQTESPVCRRTDIDQRFADSITDYTGVPRAGNGTRHTALAGTY